MVNYFPDPFDQPVESFGAALHPEQQEGQHAWDRTDHGELWKIENSQGSRMVLANIQKGSSELYKTVEL